MRAGFLPLFGVFARRLAGATIADQVVCKRALVIACGRAVTASVPEISDLIPQTLVGSSVEPPGFAVDC